MFNRIPSSYALIAATFLLNLPSVRLSDCRSNILQSLCQGVNSVKNYLDNPFGPSNESLEVRCEVQDNDPPVRWSLSPDGTEGIEINTSLAKYTVTVSDRENTLHINGVDASDEGIYRCVYANARVLRLCIKVYAIAVFASCPSSYGGCSEPENISVTAGEDVHFDASIVHMLGGNCGFKQSVDTVELRNCSNINCTSWSTRNDRILTTMSPDIERRFILSHSTVEDSGVYQVVVSGENPQTGAQSTSITKTYRVTVQVPTTTIGTTEVRESTVANGTSFPTTTTDGSSAKSILYAILAVTVTILAICIVLIITLVLLLWKRKIRTLRKLKTLQLSRDDIDKNERVGQEEPTIDGEDITITRDVAETASSQILNENDSAHHSDSSTHTAPLLCGNQQVLQDNNASSSSGTSTPAPEHQSNDDQDILRVLQDSNASSSSGSSTPAPEQQSNDDQDILCESQRIETSPKDVGEPLGPSEIQRAKREGLRLDLSSRPTLPDLMNHVAAKTPTKWMVLGIQLGLEAAQLQALDHQHRGKSDSIFADIFDCWGKSSGLKPVTWSTMIEALKSESVGEMALAHRLESTVLSTCRDSNNNMDDGWQQSQE